MTTIETVTVTAKYRREVREITAEVFTWDDGRQTVDLPVLAKPRTASRTYYSTVRTMFTGTDTVYDLEAAGRPTVRNRPAMLLGFWTPDEETNRY